MALPPPNRQYIRWYHVVNDKPEWNELPSNGLIVTYNDCRYGVGDVVLYFDGKVQIDSDVHAGLGGLDHYLIVTPDRFKIQPPRNC